MMALVDGQRSWLTCAVGVLFVFGLTPSASPIDDACAARLSIQEPLDRGLIARPLADGSIYVSWRLLDSDPNNVAFHLYRRSGRAAPVRLTKTPIRQTTDFLDRSAPRGRISSWFVRPVTQNHEGKASKEVTATPGDNVQSFVSIPLKGEYTFQKVGIADLDDDGAYDFVIKHPHLIVERGTYSLIVVIAYRLDGEKLHPVWRWTNTELGRAYSGQGAHWMHSADVDRDGRAEVILGSAVLDDNGKALWSTGLGHPDHSYVGDLDPKRPGLEIYYGIETRQKERNGMCLVDAATGRILWGHEGYTRHVHSHGLCSDIDARYAGSECYSADTDEQKKWAWARLRTCEGQVISEENLGGFGAPAILWDADPQRELLLNNRIVNYGGDAVPPQWQGSVAAVADVLGDWREELISSVPGELRIYATTIPAHSRHACLMQDPIYRIDVAHAAMGYYQVPMLSVDLASQMGQ